MAKTANSPTDAHGADAAAGKKSNSKAKIGVIVGAIVIVQCAVAYLYLPGGDSSVKAEVKDEPKEKAAPEHDVNAEAKPETKEEQKTGAKEEMKSETKEEPKPEGEAGPKLEATAEMPSSLTPEIVTRVHKLYEELGREEVKAVQEWEEKKEEIPAAKTEGEQKPKNE